MAKKITDREAEYISPASGIGSNDPSIEALYDKAPTTANTIQAVKSEMQNTTSEIEKVKKLYPDVDISAAQADLSQDKQALSALQNIQVHESLLAGKIVKLNYVNIGKDGKPTHFFGKAYLSLQTKLKEGKPVVSLGYRLITNVPKSKPISIEPPYKSNLHLQLSHSFSALLRNILHQKSDKNQDKTDSTLRHVDEILLKRKGTEQIFELSRILTLASEFHFKDSTKSESFKKQINELAKVGIVTKGQDNQVEFIKELGIIDIPTKYKGVEITPKQVKTLLTGESINLKGLIDPKLGLYDANLSFNILKGTPTEKTKELVHSDKLQPHKQAVLDHNPLTTKLTKK